MSGAERSEPTKGSSGREAAREAQRSGAERSEPRKGSRGREAAREAQRSGAERSEPTKGSRGPRTALLVSSSYPFHRGDFRASFVHGMARELAAAGAAVRVLTPATPEGGAGREKWDGVEVERFAYAGCLGTWAATGGDGIVENVRARPSRAATLPGLCAAMTAAVRRELAARRPELVVAHWLVPAGVAVAAARPRAGTRVVFLGHGSDVHLLARLPGGAALVRWLSRVGTVAATSDALAAKLRRLAGVPVEVVPLGVDGAGEAATGYGLQAEAATGYGLQASATTRSCAATGVSSGAEPEAWSLKPGAGSLRLCTMGRLVPGKGLERTLDVLERLPHATLSIAGDGSLRPVLAAQIARRGLCARLTGPVLGDAKREFLRGHDLFLFLGDRAAARGGFEDNLPVSVLEALAAGLPVVATRTGAMEGLLGSSGAGRLVAGDPAAIARAIANLGPAERERMAARAVAVAGRHTWRASLERLGVAVPRPGSAPA